MEALEKSGNRLQRNLAKLAALPILLRHPLRQWLLRRAIPFTGTAKVIFERVDDDGVTLRLANRRRVRNHVGGVHAAATALLAETASGVALGMHIPDNRLPLLKSMRIDYTQRAQGGLIATAHLTDVQRRAVCEQERGDVNVAVTVRDATGNTTVDCEMIWAWVPKKK